MFCDTHDLIPMTNAQREKLQQEAADLEKGETKCLFITDSDGRPWQCRVTRNSFEFESETIRVSLF